MSVVRSPNNVARMEALEGVGVQACATRLPVMVERLVLYMEVHGGEVEIFLEARVVGFWEGEEEEEGGEFGHESHEVFREYGELIDDIFTLFCVENDVNVNTILQQLSDVADGGEGKEEEEMKDSEWGNREIVMGLVQGVDWERFVEIMREKREERRRGEEAGDLMGF